MEPHIFSHLLLARQMDEYLCSFLEAVLRLVNRHLLQPVFRLLLRFAAAAVVVVVLVLVSSIGSGIGQHFSVWRAWRQWCRGDVGG